MSLLSSKGAQQPRLSIYPCIVELHSGVHVLGPIHPPQLIEPVDTP